MERIRPTGAARVFLGTVFIETAAGRRKVVCGERPGRQVGEEQSSLKAQHGDDVMGLG